MKKSLNSKKSLDTNTMYQTNFLITKYTHTHKTSSNSLFNKTEQNFTPLSITKTHKHNPSLALLDTRSSLANNKPNEKTLNVTKFKLRHLDSDDIIEENSENGKLLTVPNIKLKQSTKTTNLAINPFLMVPKDKNFISQNRLQTIKSKGEIKFDLPEENKRLKQPSSRKIEAQFDENGFLIKSSQLKSSNRIKSFNKQQTKDSLDQLLLNIKEKEYNEIKEDTLPSPMKVLNSIKNKNNINTLATSYKFMSKLNQHRQSIDEARNKENKANTKGSQNQNQHNHRSSISSNPKLHNQTLQMVKRHSSVNLTSGDYNAAIEFLNIISNESKHKKIETSQNKRLNYKVFLKNKNTNTYNYKNKSFRIPKINKTINFSNYIIRDFNYIRNKHFGKKNEALAREFYKENQKKVLENQIEQNIENLQEFANQDVIRDISVMNQSFDDKVQVKPSLVGKDYLNEIEKQRIAQEMKNKTNKTIQLLNDISIEYDFSHQNINEDYIPVISVKSNNLRRLQRVRKIVSEGIDIDKDPLGIGDLNRLRKMINKNKEEIQEGIKRIGPPKFIKTKFKIRTNSRYKAISGVNFGNLI